MVRLLQLTELAELQDYAVFQSHNGAIAAWSLVASAAVGIEAFNPTMVRLLLARSKSSFETIATFQSHNGAIAAMWRS